MTNGINPSQQGRHWSLVIGHWSLVIGHWSLVIGHWSLVIGHFSAPKCPRRTPWVVVHAGPGRGPRRPSRASGFPPINPPGASRATTTGVDSCAVRAVLLSGAD